jgi:hypothetical protein
MGLKYADVGWKKQRMCRDFMEKPLGRHSVLPSVLYFGGPYCLLLEASSNKPCYNPKDSTFYPYHHEILKSHLLADGQLKD